jgi:hypothetical protein
LIADRRFELRSNRPSQAPIADNHIDDAMIHESGRNAASCGFYFRKLGQRLACMNSPSDLQPNYLIFDSL